MKVLIEFKDIDIEIKTKITELGSLWKHSKNNPQSLVSESTLEEWDQLILKWAEDENLPLIIRRSGIRGQEFKHPSGRKIIISDNTFALWVYHNVLSNQTFTIGEIKSMLNNNEVPMVYALKKEEKGITRHTKTLGKYSLSEGDSKWKLCHIIPVGLNSRKGIEEFDIETIKKHFINYANPRNMFVLPKEIGGLGEIQEFINEQK